jgi:hypothetical protein
VALARRRSNGKQNQGCKLKQRCIAFLGPMRRLRFSCRARRSREAWRSCARTYEGVAQHLVARARTKAWRLHPRGARTCEKRCAAPSWRARCCVVVVVVVVVVALVAAAAVAAATSTAAVAAGRRRRYVWPSRRTGARW